MIIDTYSKRRKRLESQTGDVFTYDEVPQRLRVQIAHILDDAIGIGEDEFRTENQAFQWLQKKLSAEFGLVSLGSYDNDKEAFIEFFREEANTDQALDMIELAFQILSSSQEHWSWRDQFGITLTAKQAVKDLNQRFLENSLGYSFVDGPDSQLIRKDNEHLHKEAVIPALMLLHEEGFEGANEEYRSAHDHYRHSKYKECLNDCLKSFESTLKTISKKKGWSYDPKDTAKNLIKTCLDNGLLPAFTDSHLNALRMNLEGTIPTVRNKLSGHGQGDTPVTVPKFYAEFMLHDTAATIVFLVEAFKARK